MARGVCGSADLRLAKIPQAMRAEGRVDSPDIGACNLRQILPPRLAPWQKSTFFALELLLEGQLHSIKLSLG